jgi:hypothetical protein
MGPGPLVVFDGHLPGRGDRSRPAPHDERERLPGTRSFIASRAAHAGGRNSPTPIVPVVVGQGTRLFPDTGPDTALDLVDSRATSKGITIQVYRPTAPSVCNRLKHVTR